MLLVYLPWLLPYLSCVVFYVSPKAMLGSTCLGYIMIAVICGINKEKTALVLRHGLSLVFGAYATGSLLCLPFVALIFKDYQVSIPTICAIAQFLIVFVIEIFSTD